MENQISYQCSNIKNSIFLGGIQSLDCSDIKKVGITHVLVLGETVPIGENFREICTMTIPVQEEPCKNLTRWLSLSRSFLRDGTRNGNKTLIVSKEDRCKGVVVVIDFLCRRKTFHSFEHGLSYLRKHHPPANPNMYFINYLTKEYPIWIEIVEPFCFPIESFVFRSSRLIVLFLAMHQRDVTSSC